MSTNHAVRAPLFRAINTIWRPVHAATRKLDSRFGITARRNVRAIGQRAAVAHSQELLAMAIRHFDEPLLVSRELCRLIGYGESAVDCYLIVTDPFGTTNWRTCVGGYTFLNRLARQGVVLAHNGEVWNDLVRLEPYGRTKAPLSEFVLDLQHDDDENRHHLEALASDIPEPGANDTPELARIREAVNFDVWRALPNGAREDLKSIDLRKSCCVSPQLKGLLGQWVEVEPDPTIDVRPARRFVVGQSKGFAPHSLELDALGAPKGRRAPRRYASVKLIT